MINLGAEEGSGCHGLTHPSARSSDITVINKFVALVIKDFRLAELYL